MRKTRKFSLGWKLFTALSSLTLALVLGILAEPFSIVSNAQSEGKVIAQSAKIRKEANTSSEVLGSALKDDKVTINNQVKAGDNTIWYQVFVNSDTLGYIRSDLVQITDGTTPPVASETTTNNATSNTTSNTETNNTATDNTTASTTTNTSTTNEPAAEVTAVEPMSASVTGGQSVRVRSNASTNSQIVTMAQNGLALTVKGQATGTDGKLWYQVNFISNGSEVTGFIRSDYVALSGELVPVTDEPEIPQDEETPQEPETPAEPVVTKDWDTQYDDGKWWLVDNVEQGRYDINNIFETVKNNQIVLENTEKKVTSQKIGIIILIILLVVMSGVIAYLIFKIKDMLDSAYFAEVEKETVRRRTADRPVGTDKRVMHTVGAERAGSARPAGARPAGAPAQGGQRPAGARPAGAPVQGGQRPAGARPAGAPVQGGQRPVESRTAAPARNHVEQNTHQAGTAKPQQQRSNAQNPGWKSKNFMTDDDEFEFEFLNWDGEDE